MDKDAYTLVWKYETEGMTRQEAVAMFRLLMRSGEIWQLPDHYLQQIERLNDLGLFNVGGGQ